jgi:hypothetical protein
LLTNDQRKDIEALQAEMRSLSTLIEQSVC